MTFFGFTSTRARRDTEEHGQRSEDLLEVLEVAVGDEADGWLDSGATRLRFMVMITVFQISFRRPVVSIVSCGSRVDEADRRVLLHPSRRGAYLRRTPSDELQRNSVQYSMTTRRPQARGGSAPPPESRHLREEGCDPHHRLEEMRRPHLHRFRRARTGGRCTRRSRRHLEPVLDRRGTCGPGRGASPRRWSARTRSWSGCTKRQFRQRQRDGSGSARRQ